MPRLVVTGATGFVGRHLVPAALAGGWAVTAVVRSSGSGRAAAAGARVAAVRGLDDPGLAAALAGADAVAHLAQVGAERGGDTYDAVNVAGTREVLAAARRAGVSQAALFSGLGVAHYGVRPRCTNRYFLSKLVAEVEAWRCGLRVSVFRPPYIVGPGDGLLRSLLGQMREGVVERPGDGLYRLQPVAVSDAVAAVLAAFGAGCASAVPCHRAWDLVGPAPVSYDAFVERLGAAARETGAAGGFVVRGVPVEEADRRAREGGYQGMPPDELDCLLCDEVADPGPLVSLLGRPLLGLDEALRAALRTAPPA